MNRFKTGFSSVGRVPHIGVWLLLLLTVGCGKEGEYSTTHILEYKGKHYPLTYGMHSAFDNNDGTYVHSIDLWDAEDVRNNYRGEVHTFSLSFYTDREQLEPGSYPLQSDKTNFGLTTASFAVGNAWANTPTFEMVEFSSGSVDVKLEGDLVELSLSFQDPEGQWAKGHYRGPLENQDGE